MIWSQQLVKYIEEIERTVTTHLVPMTRGQDEGPGVDYLAYIPSLCRVTMEIVKDNKRQ